MDILTVNLLNGFSPFNGEVFTLTGVENGNRLVLLDMALFLCLALGFRLPRFCAQGSLNASMFGPAATAIYCLPRNV